MMTRLIQRTALRLLSAGAFSFCSLTLVSTLAADPVVGSALAGVGQVRHEAIKVELALLSDSSAYAQPLTVRAQANGVEIQGTVASEAVRQHIIQLARRNSYSPILDKIAVVGAVSQEMAPLVQTAHTRLVRELGAQADAIKIRVESGKLKLTGKVRSVEDKLHASRTLRGLPGCGGLVNQLEVKADSGPSFTLVTHATEEPEVAPDAPLEFTGPVMEEDTPPIAAKVPPRAHSIPTLPSGLPASRVMSVQVDSVDHGKNQSHTVLYVVPTGSACKTCPTVQKSAPVEAAERQSIWGRLRPESRPEIVPHRPSVRVPAAEATPVESETPAVTQGSATNTVWPPAHRTVPVSTPAPAGTLYQSRPLGNLTRPKVVPQPASTAQLALQTPAPAPAAVPATKPVPELEPVSKLEPVEATPEVVKPVTKAPVAPKPASSALLRKVKSACGAYARDVRVETGPDGIVAVHVYATSGSEQLLTSKLFDVPELSQSNVRLHVHLAS